MAGCAPARGARLAALTSGGAIPETAQYRVIAEPDGTVVGTVDEDFAVESLAGDVFLLGNTSWRVQYVRGGEVQVHDAEGAPPSIPFWLGEAPGRTREFSAECSQLRARPGRRRCKAAEPATARVAVAAIASAARRPGPPSRRSPMSKPRWPPSAWCRPAEEIVFERFFDESGGMQLVIHAPLGARINRAWGLALRKRFCRSFDFELQASADDDGIVLSLGPQHSLPIENLFRMLNADNVAGLLEQALLAVPMFQVRWRWNVTRSLVVLRQQGGQRVPPHMQRFRSDDLLAAVFPETVGCLENHSGDVDDSRSSAGPADDARLPARGDGHRRAGRPCWTRRRRRGHDSSARDTREPSPFSYELLNANPYAFLDGAPLEERRARAVATRRTLSTEDLRDLARLDPEAIAQVAREAWPLVRSADELHDALMSLVAIDELEAGPWSVWLRRADRSGRATRVVRPGRRDLWIAAESWPVLQAPLPTPRPTRACRCPSGCSAKWPEATPGLRWCAAASSTAVRPPRSQIGEFLGLEEHFVSAALEALEGQGTVLRGSFTESAQRSIRWSSAEASSGAIGGCWPASIG